jgi:zinc protease
MPYARIDVRGASDISPARHTIQTLDKANAVYYAGLVLPLSDSDPDYPALVIGNHILGSSGLSSRLGDRIRQQEGFSYSVRSSFRANNLDPRAQFTIYAISNPSNMDKLADAVVEEIHRLLDEGVSAEELAEAKRGYLQRQQLGRNSDRSLVNILADTLEAGRTMEYYAAIEKTIEALDANQVQAALRKHIRPEKLVVVTAGDLAESDARWSDAGSTSTFAEFIEGFSGTLSRQTLLDDRTGHPATSDTPETRTGRRP